MKSWVKKALVKAGLKLAPYLPNWAKKAAKFMDGKKTITGLVIAGAGIGCLFIPGMQQVAEEVIWTGATTTAAGLAHKWEKYKKSKQTDQNTKQEKE